MFKKLAATVLFLLIAVPCWSAGTVTLGEGGANTPGMGAYKWSWATGAGDTTASDSTKTHKITGKIVGVLAVESDVGTAYTIKILDSVGRDVLQGLFTDTEASATATADNQYRVPVDDVHGGYIWLWNEEVYLDISSAGNSDSGDVWVYIQAY